MWVTVISRFKHRETGEYHNPGKKVNLSKEDAESLAAKGCVELPSRKRKKPIEDQGAEL